MILAFYFCVRKVVLGSFTSDSLKAGLFHYSSLSMMWQGWVESLKMIIMPVSSTIVDKYGLLHIVWACTFLGLVCISLIGLRNNRNRISLVTFLFAWFVTCLIPVHSILQITPDLTNARYGYGASLPLCFFLGLGIASDASLKTLVVLRRALVIFILSLSCSILRLNNLAWIEIGQLSNNLLDAFRQIHHELKGDQRIYIVNVPAKFRGVVIGGMHISESMNHRPFTEQNFSNCKWLQSDDQDLPIGLIAQDIRSNKNQFYFYYLDMADRRLHKIDLDKLQSSNASPAKTRYMSLTNNGQNQFVSDFTDLGTPRIIPDNRGTLEFSFPVLDCWNTDLIIVEATVKNIAQFRHGAIAELSYCNDITSNNEKTDHALSDTIAAPLRLDRAEQTLVFPMRGIPAWSLGGHCRRIRVSFPKDCIVDPCDRISAANARSAMPSFRIRGWNYCSQIGQIDLTAKCPETNLIYDARSMNDCDGVAVEALSKVDNFTQLNSPNSDNRTLIELIDMSGTGDIKLTRAMFPCSGTYKVRLRPIDKSGKQAGLCSDHVTLLVDK